MDLIRCRQWGLAATLPAKAALKKDFADVIIRYFKVAAPVVDALNTPLAAAFVPRKRVLFRPALSRGSTRICGVHESSKPAPIAGFRGRIGQKPAKIGHFRAKT